MVEALHWVKENIATFGGDPDNVTIMGQGAGAHAALALMSMPNATRGLFHRAVLQSLPAFCCVSVDKASNIREDLLAFCGVKTVKELETVPVAHLMEFMTRKAPQPFVPWRPVADEKSGLPVNILTAVKTGAVHKIPVIMGTNVDERKIFTAREGETMTDQACLKYFRGKGYLKRDMDRLVHSKNKNKTWTGKPLSLSLSSLPPLCLPSTNNRT
jgi:para-nitrobenzyl esterase